MKSVLGPTSLVLHESEGYYKLVFAFDPLFSLMLRWNTLLDGGIYCCLFFTLFLSCPVLTHHAPNTLQIYSLGNRETMQALASCQSYDQRAQHCMSQVSDEFTSSLA